MRAHSATKNRLSIGERKAAARAPRGERPSVKRRASGALRFGDERHGVAQAFRACPVDVARLQPSDQM